jgi:hypothetical protein
MGRGTVKPKSISASSLATASTCLARYKAENMNRGARTGSTFAADIGSAVHGGLETYVKQTQIEKKFPEGWELLLAAYRLSYQEVFRTADYATPEYLDGLNLTRRWLDRTDFTGIEVLSVEVKSSKMVPTTQGPIPFNYIWDRCDFFVKPDGTRVIKIVDYKTVRANISHDDLRRKIQARMYAVFARMQFADLKPDEIWIEFDLLRYERVGVIFTKEQDLESWQWVKTTVETILATDENKPPETIGYGCRWCVRKANCKTLESNVAVQGAMALTDMAEIAERRVILNDAKIAIEYVLGELDATLLKEAERLDLLEYDAGKYTVIASAKATRTVDAQDVVDIVGADVISRYGTFGVTALDKLLKSGTVSDEQAVLLKKTIKKKFGEATVKIASREDFKP